MTGLDTVLQTFAADLNQIAKMLTAAAFGILIGYERSFHGRAAGMRTYAIVAMASAMLIMVHGWSSVWFGASSVPQSPADDATRVIQGIVTGIGFLGAGVIMREGFSIRGLSTAAAIWLTAAVGILVGLGFYVAAGAATLMTMLIMSEVRILEHILPHQVLLRLEISFETDKAPALEALRSRLRSQGLDITDWSLKTTSSLRAYDLALKGYGRDLDARLAEHLVASTDIAAFALSPSHS